MLAQFASLKFKRLAVSSTQELPVLPLRDVVVFPHMVVPLFVGREKSIDALETAMNDSKKILLLTQKDPEVENPTTKDLYRVGSMANILQLLHLQDGTVKVLVEGVKRAKVNKISADANHFKAVVEELDDIEGDAKQAQELADSALNLFERYLKLNKNVKTETLRNLKGIVDFSRFTDTLLGSFNASIKNRQKILENVQVNARLAKVIKLLENQLDVIKVEKRIRGRVKNQMEKSQREYYLNEQLKAIQKELGELGDDGDEMQLLTKRVEDSKMPKSTKEKVMGELRKLKMLSPMSAEAGVVRTYIETLVDLPWKQSKSPKIDLAKASSILDEDHHGLEEVKERILEHLAVQQRVKKLNGPIICLVGPPGVGKTSLGRSIAQATGRTFTRMALGGVRDEAEIRGHRRTYIGAMPGKIIQNINKVGANNPLFLLDEIDKMASDFRGDPTSALLEVLDPEQNNTFNDHYLEVDYDLSNVMFVATSNSMNIPGPLLDRMEVIRIPGYTEVEKCKIARDHLLPKQFEKNGIEEAELEITDAAVMNIVRLYTREAGVRNLNRELSKICRKAVKSILIGEKQAPIKVDENNLDDFLGVERFRYGEAEQEPQIGEVTGLAWTEVGGELLSIESAIVPGKGKLNHTGKLGEVMQESIQAAMTVVRAQADLMGIDETFYEKNDIHVHVPEGATPKDGPSAGIAVCTSLVSILTKIPVKHDVAMTGEITLRGEVLPIGGLKEKLLAAHRGSIKTVLIPKDNEKDLVDVPDEVKSELKIIPVQWISGVLEEALLESPYKKMSQSVAREQSGSLLGHH